MLSFITNLGNGLFLGSTHQHFFCQRRALLISVHYFAKYRLLDAFNYLDANNRWA